MKQLAGMEWSKRAITQTRRTLSVLYQTVELENQPTTLKREPLKELSPTKHASSQKEEISERHLPMTLNQQAILGAVVSSVYLSDVEQIDLSQRAKMQPKIFRGNLEEN